MSTEAVGEKGDKDQLTWLCDSCLAREGFSCLSASSYRLSQEDIWPAQIQDVNCAIRYMRANSDRVRDRFQ